MKQGRDPESPGRWAIVPRPENPPVEDFVTLDGLILAVPCRILANRAWDKLFAALVLGSTAALVPPRFRPMINASSSELHSRIGPTVSFEKFRTGRSLADLSTDVAGLVLLRV